MTTVIVIFGGLAVIGWLSDQLQPSREWRDMQNRMTAPVQASRPTASHHEAKPRIISPLDETYEDAVATL